MNFRIGCSGFYYKEWKEIFYPKGLAQKDWFKFYSSHYNTIEINSTFYKMPTQKSFEKWYNDSPPDFRFTIKAPRLVTHYKQLNDCQSLLSDFYQTISDALKEKLSCVLFQFPPKFSFNENRMQLLFEAVNPTFKNIAEFRHASWWDGDVIKKLGEQQIVFCGQSFPSDLPDMPIENHSTLYYRFHGVPVLYKSEYEESFITDFYTELPTNIEEIFIYFNNTWGSGALTNSRQLLDLINRQR